MIDIVFEAGDGDLRALVLEGDAVPSCRPRISASTAEHEVERGVEFTDHYRRNRDPLTLSVVISDAPLQNGAVEHTRRADAWQLLNDAVDSAWPAIVTVGVVGTFEDHYLTEATTELTAADGSWLRLELTFMPIRQVSIELVEDTLPDRDRRTANHGAVATEEATPRETESLSFAMGNSFSQTLAGGF